MKFRQLCFRNQRSCKAHLNFILSKIHAQTVFDFSKKWDAISLVAVEPLLWITQVWGSYGVAVLYEGVYQGKLEGQRTETPDQLVTIPVTCAQHKQRRCTCSCQWGIWGTNSSQHLEFVEIPQHKRYKETELEKASKTNIEQFLLESDRCLYWRTDWCQTFQSWFSVLSRNSKVLCLDWFETCRN